MSCPSAAQGKRKTRYANGPADAAYARNDEQMFERLLRLCDAQGWSRKRGRVGSDGDGSRKPGPSGLTVKIQQRIPRPADGQCGAAKRAGIDSNWSNKRLHVDEGVGMVSLPGQHPPATSSLGGGSNPNPTRGGGSGGGGGGAGGESGSSTAVAAGSSSSANVAASNDTGMGYPATSSGLPPGYDATPPQRYPKVGSPQGFPQRLSETPTEHQQPHTQLLQQQQQQQLQRRQQQQQQEQQQQRKQQQEQQQQRKQQQQQQQLQRQQQQQQQQQQQLQRQQQQHQQQLEQQQQRQQQSQQQQQRQQQQQKQKQKQRGAAGVGHLSPLPNGHQSSAPTYAEDPSMGLPYDAAQRVSQTQQAVAGQLRNGPPHGVLQTGTRRRAVTPADGYLQQMGGINTSVAANNGHGQGPEQYQEPNDPWTATVHPGNNVFPQGGFHAHAPYYQPQQSPLPTAAAAALGGAVAVAHEANGTIVYNSRETSPLVQPALDMSAVGRAPSVAGGRGASLPAAQSQPVDKGLLEALGMGEGGHRPPAQAGGLLNPSSQFQQRDGLGARSTVEPPELAWVTDHRGPVDRDRLLNGTEGTAAGLGGLGQHYGDLRHASPPARFNDDSAYTENLEAAQIAARSLLPADGRRAAARSAAEGMMHLGI